MRLLILGAAALSNPVRISEPMTADPVAAPVRARPQFATATVNFPIPFLGLVPFLAQPSADCIRTSELARSCK